MPSCRTSAADTTNSLPTSHRRPAWLLHSASSHWPCDPALLQTRRLSRHAGCNRPVAARSPDRLPPRPARCPEAPRLPGLPAVSGPGRSRRGERPPADPAGPPVGVNSWWPDPRMGDPKRRRLPAERHERLPHPRTTARPRGTPPTRRRRRRNAGQSFVPEWSCGLHPEKELVRRLVLLAGSGSEQRPVATPPARENASGRTLEATTSGLPMDVSGRKGRGSPGHPPGR